MSTRPIHLPGADPASVTTFPYDGHRLSELEEPAEEPKPDEGKDPAAVALGRKGGLKGGAARARSLTKKRRSDIAKKAAKARWKQ